MARYRIEQNNYIIGYSDDIVDARNRAFSYLMEKKKFDVYIVNTRTGNLAGVVYYEGKKKDRYGRVYGPMFWSEPRNEDYLLDYDGTIFSIKTGRRMPGQYARKRR